MVVFTRCCSLQEFPRFPTDPLLGPEKSCASSTTVQKRWVGCIYCHVVCLHAMPALIKKQICCAQVLMGKKMEDWLRFSVCYWHSFCATGTEDALERFCLTFIMHSTWAFHLEPSCGVICHTQELIPLASQPCTGPGMKGRLWMQPRGDSRQLLSSSPSWE